MTSWRGDLRCSPEWNELLSASRSCDEQAATARRRGGRRAGDEEKRRALRALSLIQMGELSSARQALEGAAPGTEETREALQDPGKRPQEPYEPLPARLRNMEPDTQFQLDEDKFACNVRSGPSGMSARHCCWGRVQETGCSDSGSTNGSYSGESHRPIPIRVVNTCGV